MAIFKVLKEFTRLLNTKVGIIIFIMLVIWQVYEVIKPDKPEIEDIRKEIVQSIASTVAREVPVYSNKIPALTVFDFQNDYSNLVTNNIRETLISSGKYIVEDRSAFDKIKLKLDLQPNQYGDTNIVFKELKNLDSDYTLWGIVKSFKFSNNNATVVIKVNMIENANKNFTFLKEYNVNQKLGELHIDRTFSDQIADTSFIWKLISLSLFIIVFPFLLRKFLVKQLAKRDNVITFLLLAVIFIIDCIFCFALLGFNLINFGSYVFLLFGTILAFIFHTYLFAFIVETNN